MRRLIFFVFSVALASTISAHALDCSQVAGPVDKIICGSPKLKKADKEMAEAYFGLLRQTTDREFHEALIRSQRRWLETRSFGADRFGLAESVDKTDDREVILKMTRDRLEALRTAGPIKAMKAQREILTRDGGGAFAGYVSGATCTLMPPPYGDWSYWCRGAIHRQHKDRICSSVLEWSSGHETEHRYVTVVRDGIPVPLASCSTGYAGTDDQCPDSNSDVTAATPARWVAYRSDPNDGAPRAGQALTHYDADLDPGDIDQGWFDECLAAAIYPPAIGLPTPRPTPKL